MKKVAPFCLLLIIASLAGYQTVAYFTTAVRTTNVISIGSIDMDLSHLSLDEQGNIVQMKHKVEHVMPGDSYSQMPYVENIGVEDFYARVHVDVTMKASDGNIIECPVILDIDETKWVKDSDGWYRYVDIIPCGEKTEVPLFSKVTFPDEMGDKYIGSRTEIEIEAQSVQSTNNEFDNVLDVQGWPATGGIQ